MRTIKSVTIATAPGNKSKFVTKGGRPSEAMSAETASIKPKGEFSTALGSRSNASSTKIDREILVADSVHEDLREMHRERQAETADFTNTPQQGDSGGGLPAGTTTSDIVTRNIIVNVIEDIVTDTDPYRTNKTLNRIFRDMYQHDATSGAAITLMSTLPWSEFSVTGLKDEKTTQIYVDSIEALSVGNLLPTASIDYMTIGSILLSLSFDASRKGFNGVTPHDIDYAQFNQVPVFGIDPRIEITIPESFITTLKIPEMFERYKQYLPEKLRELIQSGQATTTGKGKKAAKSGSNASNTFELDPKTTIFIPRRGMLKDYRGVSILKRALPAWFYEKALIKGTIDQVYKRQRATTHIQAGEGDEWIATSEEMAALSNLFLSADLDPLGAVVVTRTGVNVNEIRRGDDFWRWDQNFDQIERIKLRALSISEAFVTGDATYSNMEQALSVFMDQIRTYRGQITRELFYEKMFPIISHANNITKQRYGVRSTSSEFASYGATRIIRESDGSLVAIIGSDTPVVKELGFSSDAKIDLSKYLIPEINWHKRLLPEADNDYLAMLTTLDQQGLPINIRGLAAAGGQKVDKLIEGFEEDLKIREKIAQHRQKIREINKAYGIVDPNDPSTMQEAGTDDQADSGADFANWSVARELGIGSVRPQSLLSQGNPGHPDSEFTDYDSQGKRRVLTKQGRGLIANRFNKRMASAAAEMARQENARNKAERATKEPGKKFYHAKK